MKKIVYLPLVLLALPLGVSAQDDMYFVPTKANVAKSVANYGMPRDTYYSGSRRTVDDYNRQGSFVQSIDSMGNDIVSLDGVVGVYPDSTATTGGGDYACTRRMSRFDDYVCDDPYLAGYADGRFDSWAWGRSWYCDYPYYCGYYGYGSWYWDYPYYYGAWGWGRPWHGWGWYAPYYGHVYGGPIYAKRNGERHFSSSDFRGARGSGGSTAMSGRGYGNFGGQRSAVTQGNFSGLRGSANRQTSTYNRTSTFGSARTNGSFGGVNNGGANNTMRQSSSFSGRSSFGSSRSSGSFSGARGGAMGGGSMGGGARGGSFSGRR